VEPKEARESKAFRPKNVYGVISAVAKLAVDVHGRSNVGHP
jgi:hypothetical protein